MGLRWKWSISEFFLQIIVSGERALKAYSGKYSLEGLSEGADLFPQLCVRSSISVFSQISI